MLVDLVLRGSAYLSPQIYIYSQFSHDRQHILHIFDFELVQHDQNFEALDVEGYFAIERLTLFKELGPMC